MDELKAGLNAQLGVAASLVAGRLVRAPLVMSHRYEVECFDAAGRLKWRDAFDNLITNVGLDEILDKFYKGSAYTAAHYVGLKNTGSLVVGDTMGSHAGWTENVTYSNANRPTFTPGTVSGQSVDNSASKASFNINGSTTIFGAFMATDNTKSGTAGILIGGGDFAASRAVESGDTLNVTVTATAANPA